MKKDNKKALYESIMTSVAKEVKKVLNENKLNEARRLKLSEEELKKQEEIIKALRKWFYKYNHYDSFNPRYYEQSELRWMRRTFYDDFWNNYEHEIRKIAELCSYTPEEIIEFVDTHENEVMKMLRDAKRSWIW